MTDAREESVGALGTFPVSMMDGMTSAIGSVAITAPVLGSILPSNRAQVERALSKVATYGCRSVAVLGCSFKAGTAELRGSRQVALVERLLAEGYSLRLHDPNFQGVGLDGRQVGTAMPHIAALLVDTPADAVEGADLVIVGNAAPEFRTIRRLLRPEQRVLDLVRLWEPPLAGERYAGINW